MDGAGLNVTVLSYKDSLDFGFMADRNLVPDVLDPSPIMCTLRSKN